MALGRSVCFLLIAPLLGGCQAQLNAGCKMEALRACGDDYVPYRRQPYLPESGQELADGCTQYLRQIKCTLKFIKECLQGVPQAATLVAVNAFEENVEAICVEGSEPYKSYQKHIKCSNSVGAKLHSCLHGLHSNLQQALAEAPPKDVVSYSCCRYYDTYDCISEALTPCESVGARDFLLGIMEQVLGETLRLVCGRYKKGSENCRTLPSLPPLGSDDLKVVNFVELVIGIAGMIGRKN